MAQLPYCVTNKSEYTVDVWNIGQEAIDALIDSGIPIERHPAGFYRISFNSVNSIRDHGVFFTTWKTGRVFQVIIHDESERFWRNPRIDGYWLKLMPVIPSEPVRHSKSVDLGGLTEAMNQ